MGIGDLNMHCGECAIIDFCRSDSFGYAVCYDSRIKDMDTDM